MPRRCSISLWLLAGVQAIELHGQGVVGAEATGLLHVAEAAKLSALIVYSSALDTTAALAEVVAAGARAYPEASVRVANVSELLALSANETVGLLAAQDAIILGSGVYNGDANHELLDWLQASWPKTGSIDLSWVMGNAFCTSGGANSGGTDTLASMHRALGTFQISYAGGTNWRSSQGACAVVGKGLHGVCAIDADARKEAYYLGYRTMMLAKATANEKAIVRANGADPFEYANPNRPHINPPALPEGCNSSPNASPSASPSASPNASPPATSPHSDGAGSCFAKDVATACLVNDHMATALGAAYEACFHTAADAEQKANRGARLVLLHDLVAGDRILTLTRDGALAFTHVVAVQHKASDQLSAMLTLHIDDTASLSLTPDHALYIDGALVAAREARVGAALRTIKRDAAIIQRITVAEEAAVINVVTVSGCLLLIDAPAANGANGEVAPVLVASHPIWLAPWVLESPVIRVLANALLLAAGDVDTIMAGVARVLTKLVASCAAAFLVIVISLKGSRQSRP